MTKKWTDFGCPFLEKRCDWFRESFKSSGFWFFCDVHSPSMLLRIRFFFLVYKNKNDSHFLIGSKAKLHFPNLLPVILSFTELNFECIWNVVIFLITSNLSVAILQSLCFGLTADRDVLFLLTILWTGCLAETIHETLRTKSSGSLQDWYFGQQAEKIISKILCLHWDGRVLFGHLVYSLLSAGLFQVIFTVVCFCCILSAFWVII